MVSTVVAHVSDTSEHWQVRLMCLDSSSKYLQERRDQEISSRLTALKQVNNILR